MRMTADDRGRYRYVDVPALAKLAIGLGRIFAHRPVRLLYVFLEPQAAPPYHSLRIGRNCRVWSNYTRDSDVPLAACSFHELWEDWCAETLHRLARGRHGSTTSLCRGHAAMTICYDGPRHGGPAALRHRVNRRVVCQRRVGPITTGRRFGTPKSGESSIFHALPGLIRHALDNAPHFAETLAGIEPDNWSAAPISRACR